MSGPTLTRRRLGYGVCAVLVALGASLVPMPYFLVSPGAAVEVQDLVVIEGHETTELDGSAALLSVQLRRPSIAELGVARFDDRRAVVPLERFLPPGEEDHDYFTQQEEVFDDAFAVAAAVALRAAGFEVATTSSPQIVHVLPGGPADGILRSGDLVVEVNGVAVATAEDVVREARRLGLGDLARLVVERDGARVEVEVTADQAARMTRPGLGVTVDTTPRSVDLPFDVHLADGVEIGGPSAGLVFALAIHDLVSPENLLDGRQVTGTGTMELDGTVGRIGSVAQKVETAVRSGYELFLVPASQADEARAVARGRLVVLPVETFEDALQALRDAPRSS